MTESRSAAVPWEEVELTKLQRQAVEMRFLKGMSLREIGYAMNIHEATVRGHIDAALRRIREYMEEAA